MPEKGLVPFLPFFAKTWPHYRKWFLREGLAARPDYLACRDAIDRHMPEMSAQYRKLFEIAGGDLVSRYLSLYRPSAFMSGCTQIAWSRDEAALVRNYDYNPRWFEGVMFQTDWLQPVIGVSDCNRGLLDGMNAGGLAVSLTFGGRKIVGDGFGVPLVMRYLFEICTTVEAAIEVLRRIPLHMTCNIMLMDRSGDYATVCSSARIARRESSVQTSARTTRRRSTGRSTHEPLQRRSAKPRHAVWLLTGSPPMRA